MDEKPPVVGRVKRRRTGTATELASVQERLENQRVRFDKQGERLDRQRDRVDKYAHGLEQTKERLERQNKKLERAQEQITELTDALGAVVKAEKLRETDFRRATQQLASLEVRLGMIEEKLDSDRYVVSDADQVQARSLVDAVRREHDQVRARFQVIAGYE